MSTTGGTEDGDRWIRRFHPSPASRVKLVCLAHAGGSANFYLPLSALLAPEVEVLAIQYPGRQDRWHEPVVADIGTLADRITAALRPWTGEPLALFGHSMGAVLGFEIARRLEAGPGRPPLALFASGRRAPSRTRDERVHLLDDDDLVAEIEALQGTAPGALADPELRALVLPGVRADYRAIETYRCPPGATVATPVTVLIGDRDPRVDVAEAEAWFEHTTAATGLRVFPGGGHFYLADAWEEIAGRIRQDLALRPAAAPGRPG
ncbi:oleoyl-ACP hydrolase [Kitasatospora herbaricolor]|uniref:thioesterase II family protein n=1 Tax=Kitasatospora herbaricolor TaxID=68217 RepID=UPI00174B6B23|nr:alpha/beta fold hydrolase [Kitasatospora herbaricolor]MDQ0306308.1 surfactin synthase thioesterase subunit [Kitasatospora herbaricolor]GGV40260.1 oleoyl-ACP hydrolase [Kitasatospora herbaricolor]